MNGVLGMLQLLDRSHLEPLERRQVEFAQRSDFPLVKLIERTHDYPRFALAESGNDGTAERYGLG